ncbi:MAG: metallophosphoesterase, partial [Rickettsiaceae bacterium]|nr:metallophosphoesterase [Rickettsiaceae bacterium]
KAYKGIENEATKILLSHDPSHWDAVINKKFKDIDLTLSGHTHGFQFGVETKWLKWSPSQYTYKQWAGLYQKEKQQIYVNRGFGNLGYPGRIGILPEVTVIELA